MVAIIIIPLTQLSSAGIYVPVQVNRDAPVSLAVSFSAPPTFCHGDSLGAQITIGEIDHVGIERT